MPPVFRHPESTFKTYGGATKKKEARSRVNIEKNKLINQIKKKKKEMEKVEVPDSEKKRRLQRIRAQIKRLTGK